MGVGSSNPFPFEDICCDSRTPRRSVINRDRNCGVLANASKHAASVPLNVDTIDKTSTCTAFIALDKTLSNQRESQPEIQISSSFMPVYVVMHDSMEKHPATENIHSSKLKLYRECVWDSSIFQVTSEESTATTLTSSACDTRPASSFGTPRKHSPWVDQFLTEHRLSALLHYRNFQNVAISDAGSSDRTDEMPGAYSSIGTKCGSIENIYFCFLVIW